MNYLEGERNAKKKVYLYICYKKSEKHKECSGEKWALLFPSIVNLSWNQQWCTGIESTDETNMLGLQMYCNFTFGS